MLDLIIKNGTVIDGSGAARYQADLGIEGDRIQQLGDLKEAEAPRTIDAAGKIVTPGFVDVHNHSDSWLLTNPHMLSKTSQGFTTEVIMADGISYAPVDRYTAPHWIYYLRSLNGLRFEEYQGWESLSDYMKLLDGHNVQNSIPHIPYANVRTLACGFGSRGPDDAEMVRIRSEIEKGMEAGAVGISTGLDYIAECFASTEELVEACRVMSEARGLYVTHMRYKNGIMRALAEAVEIGKRAGVPVHISHLKASSPEEAEEILTYVDRVATQEVDFSFDVYPYVAGSTMLSFFLPYEIWEQGPLLALGRLHDPRIREKTAASPGRIPLDQLLIAWVPGKGNTHHQGKSLRAYVSETGLDEVDAVFNLLIEENLAVLAVSRGSDQATVTPFLQHPCYMLGSDGIFQEGGAIHPRQYGSATRLLGPCVRDEKLFPLEEAVRKLSGFPAQRFRLQRRGTIQEGNFADVVVLDEEQVRDQATYEDPQQYSVGIEHVVVNGVPVIENGRPVSDLPSPLPGRALAFGT